MKRVLLLGVAIIATIFSANAQVKVVSPRPDLDFKITRCAYASGTVVVDVILTNFGQEETIRFCGADNYRDKSTAYDDEGNQYTGRNSNISLGLISQGLSSGHSDVTLPQDIPLKFRVQIKNVSANATKLSLLKIDVESGGAMALRGKPIVVRNLEWTK